MDGIKQTIEAISPFTVHRIHSNLFERMFDGLLNCLSKKEARGQRLDHRGFLGFMTECRRSWNDLDYIGSVVCRKESEEPLAFAIATKRRYLEGIPDRVELDAAKTRAFTELENWSLEYVCRKDEFKGQALGSIALGALLTIFAGKHNSMVWLLLGGGFNNIPAMSLYTSYGFVVTSLGYGKYPIMSLRCTELNNRPQRKTKEALQIKFVLPTLNNPDPNPNNPGNPDNVNEVNDNANERDDNNRAGNDNDDNEGRGEQENEGDRNNGEGEGHGNRRPRRRRKQRNQPADDVVQQWRRKASRMEFRDTRQQLQALFGKSIILSRDTGVSQTMFAHLQRMVENSTNLGSSAAFLNHISIGEQAHLIASQQQIHVSQWVTTQRRQRLDDRAWQNMFDTISRDVQLVWYIFRYPFLR